MAPSDAADVDEGLGVSVASAASSCTCVARRMMTNKRTTCDKQQTYDNDAVDVAVGWCERRQRRVGVERHRTRRPILLLTQTRRHRSLFKQSKQKRRRRRTTNDARVWRATARVRQIASESRRRGPPQTPASAPTLSTMWMLRRQTSTDDRRTARIEDCGVEQQHAGGGVRQRIEGGLLTTSTTTTSTTMSSNIALLACGAKRRSRRKSVSTTLPPGYEAIS